MLSLASEPASRPLEHSSNQRPIRPSRQADNQLNSSAPAPAPSYQTMAGDEGAKTFGQFSKMDKINNVQNNLLQPSTVVVAKPRRSPASPNNSQTLNSSPSPRRDETPQGSPLYTKELNTTAPNAQLSNHSPYAPPRELSRRALHRISEGRQLEEEAEGTTNGFDPHADIVEPVDHGHFLVSSDGSPMTATTIVAGGGVGSSWGSRATGNPLNSANASDAFNHNLADRLPGTVFQTYGNSQAHSWTSQPQSQITSPLGARQQLQQQHLSPTGIRGPADYTPSDLANYNNSYGTITANTNLPPTPTPLDTTSRSPVGQGPNSHQTPNTPNDALRHTNEFYDAHLADTVAFERNRGTPSSPFQPQQQQQQQQASRETAQQNGGPHTNAAHMNRSLNGNLSHNVSTASRTSTAARKETSKESLKPKGITYDGDSRFTGRYHGKSRSDSAKAGGSSSRSPSNGADLSSSQQRREVSFALPNTNNQSSRAISASHPNNSSTTNTAGRHHSSALSNAAGQQLSVNEYAVAAQRSSPSRSENNNRVLSTTEEVHQSFASTTTTRSESNQLRRGIGAAKQEPHAILSEPDQDDGSNLHQNTINRQPPSQPLLISSRGASPSPPAVRPQSTPESANPRTQVNYPTAQTGYNRFTNLPKSDGAGVPISAPASLLYLARSPSHNPNPITAPLHVNNDDGSGQREDGSNPNEHNTVPASWTERKRLHMLKYYGTTAPPTSGHALSASNRPPGSNGAVPSTLENGVDARRSVSSLQQQQEQQDHRNPTNPQYVLIGSGVASTISSTFDPPRHTAYRRTTDGPSGTADHSALSKGAIPHRSPPRGPYASPTMNIPTPSGVGAKMYFSDDEEEDDDLPHIHTSMAVHMPIPTANPNPLSDMYHLPSSFANAKRSPSAGNHTSQLPTSHIRNRSGSNRNRSRSGSLSGLPTVTFYLPKEESPTSEAGLALARDQELAAKEGAMYGTLGCNFAAEEARRAKDEETDDETPNARQNSIGAALPALSPEALALHQAAEEAAKIRREAEADVERLWQQRAQSESERIHREAEQQRLREEESAQRRLDILRGRRERGDDEPLPMRFGSEDRPSEAEADGGDNEVRQKSVAEYSPARQDPTRDSEGQSDGQNIAKSSNPVVEPDSPLPRNAETQQKNEIDAHSNLHNGSVEELPREVSVTHPADRGESGPRPQPAVGLKTKQLDDRSKQWQLGASETVLPEATESLTFRDRSPAPVAPPAAQQPRPTLPQSPPPKRQQKTKSRCCGSKAADDEDYHWVDPSPKPPVHIPSRARASMERIASAAGRPSAMSAVDGSNADDIRMRMEARHARSVSVKVAEQRAAEAKGDKSQR